MFKIHGLLNLATLPHPEGSPLMFEMVRPFFASIAVPRPSVPSFMYAEYLHNLLRFGFVTSCNSARSVSCFQRNSSSIPRRVHDVFPLMLIVGTFIYRSFVKAARVRVEGL